MASVAKEWEGVVWAWSRPEVTACLQGSLEATLDGRDAGDFFGVSRGHRACCGTFRERDQGRHLLETTFGRTATARLKMTPAKIIRPKSLQHLLFPGGHPSRY